MTLTKRRRMFCGKSSSKSVPRRKKKDCTTEALCSPIALNSRAQGLQDLKVYSVETKMRWPDNKLSAKPMTPTSICRSSREFYVNTSLSHSHSTGARSNLCPILSL